MAAIIDGKKISAQIRDEVKQKVQSLSESGIKVTLAVILVGSDPASQVYVRNKKRACEYCGIISREILLPEETTQEKLISKVEELNADPSVNGILVQLPVPRQIDPDAVIRAISPLKDVDGFHPQNVGAILRTAAAVGATGVVIPEDRACGITPAAVRASAGGTEHVRVAHVVNLPRAIEELKEAGLWFTGLDFGNDAKNYTDIDFKGRVGLVVGAEGNGISRLVREKCDFIAVLPMPGGFESLNAATAASVAMYEILRQRRT